MFWLTFFITYILILILIITIAFIILLLLLLYFIVITVIIIIVLSIISVIYFILSNFISFWSSYYDFCLCVACVACDVYVSSLNFFPFLVNDLHFIVALLVHVRNHFSFVIIVYIIIFIITIILFFSTLPAIGREFSKWIWEAWSAPTHWLLRVSRRVLFLFLFNYYHYCYYFFVRIKIITIYHMTSFNCDANEARDVDLCCRCHLSNSQIVSSV